MCADVSSHSSLVLLELIWTTSNFPVFRPQETKWQLISVIFSVSVCGMEIHPPVPALWLEILLCPMSRWGFWLLAACAACSCCYSKVLLRCELGVCVLCQDWRLCYRYVAVRWGLCSSSFSLWPWTYGEVKTIALPCMYAWLWTQEK